MRTCALLNEHTRRGKTGACQPELFAITVPLDYILAGVEELVMYDSMLNLGGRW